MSDPRWQRMWDLFHDLCERPPGERAAILDRECAGDVELRREIEELLAEHDAPSVHLARESAEDAVRGLVLGPGEHVGPYVVLRTVGEGGMGVVYRAEQREPVRRTVALKLIRPGMDTREVLARFDAERQILAALDHDRIARVYDAGATADGRPYFAMELVEGEAVTEYCDRRRLGLAERLDLFREICDGIQHAHRRGVIHRDLKPSNVLVREVDGRHVPKIIDFGIARATSRFEADRTLFTQHGRLLGTPEYMSPEQAGLTGEGVDTRTDVYALGVLLYELLVGANPFDWKALRERGHAEILRTIRETEPPRPSRRLSSLGAGAVEVAARRRIDPPDLDRRVRGDLDCIVMKAMDKERERRYGSPADLVADLDRYRDHRPIEARPPSPAYRARKFARRHRVAVAAGVLVVAAIVFGGAVGAVGLVRARAAEREARHEAEVAERVSSFLVDLFQVSEPSAAAANTLTAREVLDRGVEHVRGALEGQPAVRARILRTLGEVYLRLGLYPESRPLLEDALEIERGIDGGDGPGSMATLERVAGLELETGAYARALDLYERILAHREATLGAGHLETARMLENVGTTLQAMQRSEEAVPFLERAVDVRERAAGPDDPDTAKAVYRLSIAQTDAGRLDAASESAARALAILGAAYEPDDPWLQYASNGLAVLYWRQGRLDEARPVLEGVVASIERTHGPEHPYTAQVLNNLGYLLLEQGDPEAARPLIERALAIQETALGPDHPEVAVTVLNAARLHAETGDPATAERLYDRGRRIREAAYGSGHASLVGPLRRRADTLRALGRGDEATAEDARADRIEAAAETAGEGAAPAEATEAAAGTADATSGGREGSGSGAP